jgi:hypothetical protein
MIARALILETYSKQRDLGQTLEDHRCHLWLQERVKYSECSCSPFFGYWHEDFPFNESPR